MAATITLLESKTGSGGNEVILNPNHDCAAGDLFLVEIAASNDGSGGASCFSSVTGNGWNSFPGATIRAQILYDPGSAGAGAELIKVTIEPTVSDSTVGLFVNFSPAVSQAAVHFIRFRPGTGETASFVSADETGETGNTTTYSAPTASVTSGDTIFASAAIETDDAITGDSDTTNGDWSSIDTVLNDGGADNSCMTLSMQYKTVTATGDQDWACTSATGRDSARTYIILRSEASGATGTSAQTLPKITQSASGTETFTGAAAQTLPKLAQAASGIHAEAVSGTAAQTLPSLSQAAAGTESFTGAASQTLPAIAQAASGTETFTGTAAQTLPSLSQAASGTETFTGSAAQTLPSITQAASGTHTVNVTGAADQTLPSITQAASGTETFTGTAAQTLPSIAQAASGTETFTGAAAQTLPSISQAATGAETFAGAIAQMLPAIAQAAAGLHIDNATGTADQTLPSITQAAAGAQVYTGAAAQTLSAIIQSAMASEAFTGSIAQILPSIAMSATGTVSAAPASGSTFRIISM